MVMAGTLVSLPVVWQLADIIMALMAITNLTAILLLSPTVRILASDYLPGMRYRANSAVIAAIDPTMRFFC